MQALLAVETSGNSLGVALRTGSGLVFEENVTAGMIHGRALAPLLEKALAAQGLRPAGLSAVAVSAGPGSWTGLRIGLSAAKALAWGAGVGLIAVPSFDALALQAGRHAPGSARLVLRDARSEGFFLALFSETLEWPERWIEDSVMQAPRALAAVDAALADKGGVPVAVCGDPACLDLVAEAAGARGWQLLRQCQHIGAAAVAAWGW